MNRTPFQSILSLCTVAVCCALTALSCTDGDQTSEIEEVRTVDTPRQPAQPDATSAQRFGQEPMTEANAQPAAAQPAMPAPSASYAWDTPAGWTQGPERMMRLVTFQVDESGDTECYVSVLASAAGGLEANVARWYRQMGQEAPVPEALAELPVVDILGKPSPYVLVKGTYTAMASAPMYEYAMLGAVCEQPDSESVFVKMVGPEAVVEAQKDAFLALCASLRVAEAPAQ
ncbi:MAG: hypothetical protein GY851_35095 [bacterium]|nr:hypothetical protein [bacterium]